MRTLLLTVCWFLVKAEKPKIRMIPNYGRVYSGDTVTLKCSGTNAAKWFFNDKSFQSNTNETLILHAVSSTNSGDYQCETTEKSDKFHINVLEYLPPAVLTLVSKNAVVYTNQAVTLQLTLHEGLTNWTCFVARKDKEFFLRIPEDEMASKTKFVFHVDVKGQMPEIIWCKHKTRGRSNSISLRTSDTLVMLEIPPKPAVLGDPLTLRCEVEGGVAFEAAAFYKNGALLKMTSDPSYKIDVVTDKDQGSYHCQADFRYNFINPPGALKKNIRSDAQTLYIRARPPTAHITNNSSRLECSCPDCPTDPRFHWYYQESSTANSRRLVEQTNSLLPDHPGEYTCQAFWDLGISRRSNKVVFGKPVWIVVLVLITLILLLIVVMIVIYWKVYHKDSTGRMDVQMKNMRKKADEDDDAYQRPLNPDNDEYHDLKDGNGGYEAVGLGRSGDQAEGGYEALKVKEQGAVYHTLHSTQAEGAEAGYEALKVKEQGAVYHTLRSTQAEGAEGGYEALKVKEQDAAYHTLHSTQAEGAEGGYEALKVKEQSAVYHTLHSTQAEGAEGTGQTGL